MVGTKFRYYRLLRYTVQLYEYGTSRASAVGAGRGEGRVDRAGRRIAYEFFLMLIRFRNTYKW
eukprot:SAG31_NODE_6427_length_2024_cov_68.560000_1_plen_63_part_00